MKIQWITQDNCGGSFLTDSQLIKFGEKNWDIECIIECGEPKTNVDLIVVSNVHGLEEAIFNNIKVPFVKIEHDYGFCTYRDALCELHDCKKCILKSLYNEKGENALFNFFMSPAQYAIHKKHLGEIPNVRFVQSQIDVDYLCTLDIVKKKGYNIAPIALREHKGIDNVLKWANTNKQKCYVFGRMESTVALQKISRNEYTEYKGLVPNVELLEHMAKAESIVFLPKWLEPTGRSAIEAVFLECKIYSNNNLGLYSWLKPLVADDLRLQMFISQFHFWQAIIEGIKEI